MDQKDLQLFLHLTKTLHFGRTSEACHVSPSNLSRVIQRLEGEVGRPLFERDNRRVELTRVGTEFKEYAEEATNQWLAIKNKLAQQDKKLSGEISLFCSVTASYSFLYELLNEFREAHPSIEIKLHTGDSAMTVDRILNESEEIGIAAIPDKLSTNLKVLTITKTPLVFIAPKSSTSQFLEEFKNSQVVNWELVPMILSETGLVRQRIDSWFRQQKIKPKIYAQVAGNEAIVSMVSLGFGMGIVPKIVVENSPLKEKISIVDVAPMLEDVDIGICILKRRMANPLIKAFWDLAKTSIESKKTL